MPSGRDMRARILTLCFVFVHAAGRARGRAGDRRLRPHQGPVGPAPARRRGRRFRAGRPGAFGRHRRDRSFPVRSSTGPLRADGGPFRLHARPARARRRRRSDRAGIHDARRRLRAGDRHGGPRADHRRAERRGAGVAAARRDPVGHAPQQHVRRRAADAAQRGAGPRRAHQRRGRARAAGADARQRPERDRPGARRARRDAAARSDCLGDGARRAAIRASTARPRAA